MLLKRQAPFSCPICTSLNNTLGFRATLTRFRFRQPSVDLWLYATIDMQGQHTFSLISQPTTSNALRRHHLRRIRLVSRPTGCQVRPVLWDLPAPLPRLQYCVLSRRLVHQIRHPSMPAWFDLARIVFFLLVVYPPRSHCGTSAMSQQPESQQTYVWTVEGEPYEAVLAQGSRSICCRICRLRCRCQLWCRPCIAFDGHIP